MRKNAWDFMREGYPEQAIQHWRDNFAKETSTSHAMELAVGYLWVKDFQRAKQHLQQFSDNYPNHADCVYALAGVAEWCMGKPIDAVREWYCGLHANFVDWSGGLTVPILLVFASLVEPHSFNLAEAEELLEKRLDGSISASWPAPLARYVAGQITLQAARRIGVDERQEDAILLHLWQLGFWAAVREYSRDNAVTFRNRMNELSQSTWDEYDQSNRLFLCKLWTPEFYLARFEASR